MYWQNSLHPEKNKPSVIHFFLVFFFFSSFVANGTNCARGGTFHKSHGSAHTSALRSQFGVWVFFFFSRYSEEKKVAVPARVHSFLRKSR